MMVSEQSEINAGQQKINGQLCHVDQVLVETIKELKLEIEKLSGFSKADFHNFNRLLEYAYKASSVVASFKPPGCEPAYTANPEWSPDSITLSYKPRLSNLPEPTREVPIPDEELTAKTLEMITETSLAHLRIEQTQQEIDLLTDETRAILKGLHA